MSACLLACWLRWSEVTNRVSNSVSYRITKQPSPSNFGTP